MIDKVLEEKKGLIAKTIQRNKKLAQSNSISYFEYSEEKKLKKNFSNKSAIMQDSGKKPKNIRKNLMCIEIPKNKRKSNKEITYKTSNVIGKTLKDFFVS